MKLYVLFLALFIFSVSEVTLAGPSCANLAERLNLPPHRALRSEVAALYRRFPQIRQNIDAAARDVARMSIGKTPVNRLAQIGEQGTIRSFNSNNDWSAGRISELPARLKRQIIDVHNLLLDRAQFSQYVRELMIDTAVLMMKNETQSTFRLTDMNNPQSSPTRNRTTKAEFLQNGQIDHQSLMTVLVARVRERGDEIAVILGSERGGFENNNTRTQRYDHFYQVPARGPFIDRYFSRGSAHGQETHLLQMDFVEVVLTNRRQFWDYATDRGTGEWVWDSLFDGTNGTIMHPEHFGPILRRHIPLY